LVTGACEGETLTTVQSELAMQDCDLERDCECKVVPVENAVIEFGAPGVGELSQRTLQLTNAKSQPLNITKITFEDTTVFKLLALRRFASKDANAEGVNWNLDDGPLRLEGEAYAEAYLAYEPTAPGAKETTLTVVSNSFNRPNWVIKARADVPPNTVAIPTGTCPAAAAVAGQANCAIDMGIYKDNDPSFGVILPGETRPQALSVKDITVTNQGDHPLMLEAVFTNDGTAREDDAIFYLAHPACIEVAANASVTLKVEFRPQYAGFYQGQLKLSGASPVPMLVDLQAAVTGPCVELAPVVAGDAEVTIDSVACPLTPATPGQPNCQIDFGVAHDIDIGYDAAAGLPKALGSKTVQITNHSTQTLWAGCTLVNDGVPETSPNEQVGAFGVFHIKQVQCLEIPVGQTVPVVVDFRPFIAGAYEGAIRLSRLGGDFDIALHAKVTGPAVCITTEDDQPADANLQFGVAPLYWTPKNATSETRRLYIENCGYEADLLITDVVPSATIWHAGFHTTVALSPSWTQPAAIPVGGRFELPFNFTPLSTDMVGQGIEAHLTIKSNTIKPQVPAKLFANVGKPEECLLVASPLQLNFGTVATNDAGVSCGGGNCVSRKLSLVLSNVGQRPCTNIQLVEPEGADLDPQNAYSIAANPNGNGFSLSPTQTSQPIDVLFKTESLAAAVNYFGNLPYRSDDITIVNDPNDKCPDNHLCVGLRAVSGGDPECELGFSPMSPANLICWNDHVAFGNVNVGTKKTVDLKVKNNGSDGCVITGAALTGANSGAFIFTPPALPITLGVGDSFTVPVAFAPRPLAAGSPFEDLPFGCMPGLLGEQLVFNYHGEVDTTDVGSKILALNGKGTRPDIDVIPGEIDFGDVTVGCCSAKKRVAIYNSGNGTLTINDLSINPPGSGFIIATPSSAIDMSLAPGESTELEVRFCAVAGGPTSGMLVISSSDDNEENFTVTLKGNGTFDSQGIDDFAQPDRPRVDVLWVVDNSGSMIDEQSDLADNFTNFILQAVYLDTDYHMGVITTDVQSEWTGKMYSCSGPLWISDTQPDAEQRNQFRCNVKTSDWPRPASDAKEAALMAARAALSYPVIEEHNAGFMREDAKLYIIVVMDEKDQSDGTPEQYVDYFRNLKGIGNPELLNISAVSGVPPDGCKNPADPQYYAAEPNQFLKDAVDLAGGLFRDICTPSWASMITELGLDVFNARRQFPLSRPANAATIQVEVCDAGGVNCHYVAEDPQNGWVFDADLNAITFQGDSVPGPSQEIKVVYTAVCYAAGD
jgi:hypothetical protein